MTLIEDVEHFLHGVRVGQGILVPRKQDPAAQAQQWERDRQASFKITNPQDCTHSMVYHKNGTDSLHCNFCDKFMYEDNGDYDDE